MNSVYVNFQDFWNKFSFIFGQLCDKKTCAFVVMGIGKKFVGWRWDGQRSLGRLRPQLAAIYLITLTAAIIIY